MSGLHRVARRGWPPARARTRTQDLEPQARRPRARAGHENSRRARMVRSSRTLSRQAPMNQASTFAPVYTSVGQSRGRSRSLRFAPSSCFPPRTDCSACQRQKEGPRWCAGLLQKRAQCASLRMAPLSAAQDQAGGEKCQSEQNGHQQRHARERQRLRAGDSTGGRARRLSGDVACRRLL